MEKIAQKKQSSVTSYPTLVGGLAVFCMFFDVENILLPIDLGKYTGPYFGLALAGFIASGVAALFVGLVSIALYDGRHIEFFSRLGRSAGFICSALILLVLGPLHGIPKSIGLLYELSLQYLPPLSLWAFVVLYLGTVFIFTQKPRNVVPILGYVLAPLCIGLMIGLIVYGISTPGSGLVNQYSQPLSSLLRGLRSGYSGMDLLEAFHFAPLLIQYLALNLPAKKGVKEKSFLLEAALEAITICAGLLIIMYIGLGLLGTKYGIKLNTYDPISLSNSLLQSVFPAHGELFIDIVVAAVTFSTALSLTTVFAEFLYEEAFSETIPYRQALLITLLLTAGTVLFALDLIMYVEKPFFHILYPALIMLALCNIAYKIAGFKPVKAPVYLTLAGATAYYLLG